MSSMEKLLVANRGEIAIRILRSANELGWNTVAIYTDTDNAHTTFAKEAVRLDSVEDFMNAEVIARIAARENCTHVHPGYGFLSESPRLALELAKVGTIVFVGPSTETLRISSDKMLSRDLAMSLGIPIAPGTRVKSTSDINAFAQTVGYPVILKALDGGGGRGIRVVESSAHLNEAYKRSLGESPSKQIFVERALTGSAWKHIEVQIIGDGMQVSHLWERDCSVQRRFQKIIEMAPSLLPRQTIEPLIEASLKLATRLCYKGLGTFEYLFNAASGDWVFLEINPRVQVEHTITEEICDIDLIRAQLLLFTRSVTLSALGLALPPSVPQSFAIQLRLTAEDPTRAFQLCPGPIKAFDRAWPTSRGVRVDSWLEEGPYGSDRLTQWVVGTDFDSLLAKVIVRGRTVEEATQKARRALIEIVVGNGTIKTNKAVLAGVMDHRDWMSNNIDTFWLERNLTDVLKLGEIVIGGSHKNHITQRPIRQDSTTSLSTGGSVHLQPGTFFNLAISAAGASPDSVQSSQTKHSLTLKLIKHNAFPVSLSGVIETSLSPEPLEFSLSQSTSVAISSGSFELANPNDSSHVPAPMAGKIIELHPALSDPGKQIPVTKGDVLIVLSVMKMENVVLAPTDGVVVRLGKGVSVGAIIGDGMLVCVLKGAVIPSRL